jgi:hypothetical protein
VARPVTDLAQPCGGHRAHLPALGTVQVLAPVGADAARLDLAEHDRVAGLVREHEIELAEPRPVVAGEDAVAEALEVLRGELLAAPAQRLRAVGRHGRRNVRPPAERITACL